MMTPRSNSPRRDDLQREVRRDDLGPRKGVNVGTVNLVAAERNEQGDLVLRLRRNAFIDLPADENARGLLERQGAPYVVQGRRMYVLGNHVVDLANRVPGGASRPAKDRPLHPWKTDALPVMELFMKSLMDESRVQDGICFSSVPGESADGDPSIVYHEDLFDAVLRALGHVPSPVVEGHAITFADLADGDFAGLGIFCAGGAFDICVAYKSLPALFFSTARGGDWIDIDVADAGSPTNGNGALHKRSGPPGEDEVAAYYRTLINCTLSNIKERFPPAGDRPTFPAPMSIVFWGGTSLSGNFIELVRAVYKGMESPEADGDPWELREPEAELPERGLIDFRRHDLVPGRGLDTGTSNVVVAVRRTEGGSLANIQRNAFLDVRSDVFTQKLLMKLGVDRVVRGTKAFVIGDPAFELANVFEKSTRRPMMHGIISPFEPDALLVERRIISSVLGPAQVDGEVCAYSVPADPIDTERNAVYHIGAIETILRGLGYSPKPVLEGHAVVLAELADEDCTGIGISCGGGMINICVAYKSFPALAFATSRGGDWIDHNVGQSLGLPSSQVCAIKESGVDLNHPRDRVEEAICIYYRDLVRYTIETIRERFEGARNMPVFKTPISMVCAGGTSMAAGFIDVFRDEFRTIDFPIEIREIRSARDPLRTVAQGCLEAALEETRARASVSSTANRIERADISATIAPVHSTLVPSNGNGHGRPSAWPVVPMPDPRRSGGSP